MITLKTLTQASSQEVFDQVARHLLTQKEKSETYDYDSDGNIIDSLCVYRADSGLSCAAGCLIGDDEYSPHLENNDWSTLVSYDLVPTNRHKDLISALQEVHDNYPVDEWFLELDRLTGVYGLNDKVLEEF